MSKPAKVQGTVKRVEDKINGDFWQVAFGISYDVTYRSDSLKDLDLDQVQIQEKVSKESSTGPVFQKTELVKGPFRPGTSTIDADTHAIPEEYGVNKFTEKQARAKAVRLLQLEAKVADLKNYSNTATVLQHLVFADNRTGVTQTAPITVFNSGFKIVYTLSLGQDGFAVVTIQKSPQGSKTEFAQGSMPPAEHPAPAGFGQVEGSEP